MSRLAEALAKSGNGGSSMTAGALADTFPAEGETFEASPESRPLPQGPAAPRGNSSNPDWIIQDGDERPGHGRLAAFRGFPKSVLEKLTVENGASTGIVEEYRKLAATLHHAQLVHGTKIIMISSAAAGEGKTLTSVNLALTLSESYRRDVLLIDCDLRKPSIHEIFEVPNTGGVLDVLKGGLDKKVPLVKVSPRLKLLLSGGMVTDPMSLLSSDKIGNLFRDASEVFDWVVVDTPPAAFLPDCNLLARAVDGALLVVRAFDTPYQLTQRAVESIGREKILGVVMNRSERPSAAKYYYGYYNYA